MPRTKIRSDALYKAHHKLTAAVEAIVFGDDWQRTLKVASKFHRYSLNNHLMIMCQRPDATLVAGFRRWLDLGRHVRKGEKGIAIFAPCKYPTKIENDDGEEQMLQQIRGFRVVHVFDISSTEGVDIPDLDAVRPKLLDGEASEGIWDALVAQANAVGFEVVRDQRQTENGYCDFPKKEIGVRPDAAPAHAVKTLVHELAHALLHADSAGHRARQEVEVESVAFIVLDALGVPSGGYSFPYVARWSDGDVEILRATAGRVTDCARAILSRLEAGLSRCGLSGF